MKTYRFCNLRKRKDFNKKQLTLQKFVLRLSFVVHGPIYGRVMGGTVNDLIQVYNWELRHSGTTQRFVAVDLLIFYILASTVVPSRKNVGSIRGRV